MTDIERQERELSRYWNELLTPGVEPDAWGVDNAAAETLRLLASMTRAPLPYVAVLRVEQGMQTYLDRTLADLPGDVSNGIDAEHRGANPWTTLASPARRFPGASMSHPAPNTFVGRAPFTRLMQLAATLLLLVALGGLFVWLAPLGERTRPGEMLPAISGGTEREMLLALTLPAEALPHGGRSFASLSDYSLPAGAETSWEATDGACCPGLRLVYVLEGVLTLRSDSGGHVLRAGINLEPAFVAPSASVTVAAGDAMLLRFEDAFISSNPGDADVRFLEITVIDGFSPLVSAPLGWVWHPDGDYVYGLAVPDQPATVRLYQTVLDPGATLAPPPGAITQLGVTVADDLPLRIGETDEIKNLSDEPVTVYVATLMPVTVEGG